MAEADRKLTKASKLLLKAEVWKSPGGSQGQSSQVSERAIYSEDYVPPPIPWDELAVLLQENWAHWACCKRKALDTVGLGWDLVPAEGVENPSEEQYDELKHFFSYPNEEETFIDFAKVVQLDYESLGNGAVEIVLEEVYQLPPEEPEEEKKEKEFYPIVKPFGSKDGIDKRRGYELGKPCALYAAPMRTIEIRRDKLLYKQETNLNKAYFRPFGSDPNAVGEDGKPLYTDKEGNLIHMMKIFMDRTTIDDYYGMPDILPAILSVKAALYVDWWNMVFFKRNMVPELVVRVNEIGEHDVDDDDLADTKELIEKHMRYELMGEEHGVLYVQQPMGLEIKFEKIAAEVKEASWRGWRLELQDAVLTAHQMPPHRVGIVRGGKTTEGALAQIETYKRSILEQRQGMWEEFFNKIILEYFGYEDWQFKFTELDTVDKQAQAEVLNTYSTIGAFTSDEILEMAGFEPREKDYLLSKIPFRALEPLLNAYATGTLPGETLEEVIKTGGFPNFSPAIAGVTGGATPPEATGAEGVQMVTDYITGRSMEAGPEETIRQDYEKKIIDEYGYSKDQVLVEVPVTFGSRVGGMADIVVYKDSRKRDPVVVVEITTEVTKEEVDQAVSYANALDAEYAVIYDGSREIVLKKVDGEWTEHAEGFPPPEGGRVSEELPAVEPTNVSEQVGAILQGETV